VTDVCMPIRSWLYLFSPQKVVHGDEPVLASLVKVRLGHCVFLKGSNVELILNSTLNTVGNSLP
jgi:hypothetical protein